MKKIIPLYLAWTLLLGFSPAIYAQEQMPKNFAYLGLEPDIVTNYLGTSARKLGYVRVTIELMLEDASYLEAAEHHSPLMRAAAIEIFGRQPEEKIISLTGREDIRLACLEKLRAIMKKETGSEMVKDVIFTKYLRPG
jgi:flagellar FliL protein